MLAALGVMLIAASCGALWIMSPRNGIIHPLATVPFLGSFIPTAIVSGLAIGVAAILSAFF
jgi:hypothetical protein